MVRPTKFCGAAGVGRKRWGARRKQPARRKPGAGSGRYVRREWTTIYRDPATGLLLQVGPDHGTEERANHAGGVIKGKRLAYNDQDRPYFTEGARAVASTVLDQLRAGGCLAAVYQQGRWVCPRNRLAAKRLEARRFDAAEAFTVLCRTAGVVRRLTGGYEFRTDRGTQTENPRAVKARKAVVARALRLGSTHWNQLIDVLLCERHPDARELRAFLAALDAYADLLRLAAAEGI